MIPLPQKRDCKKRIKLGCSAHQLSLFLTHIAQLRLYRGWAAIQVTNWQLLRSKSIRHQTWTTTATKREHLIRKRETRGCLLRCSSFIDNPASKSKWKRPLTLCFRAEISTNRHTNSPHFKKSKRGVSPSSISLPKLRVTKTATFWWVSQDLQSPRSLDSVKCDF